MLVFSAGLCCTKPRAEVLASYPDLYRFLKRYAALDHRFIANPESIDIGDTDAAYNTIRLFRPEEVVLTTFYYGHPLALVWSCARRGIPITGIYWQAKPAHVRTLANAGVTLIKLDDFPTIYHLFDVLDRARRAGSYVAILADAPSQGRRRYPFLGYHVSASSLLALYASRTRSWILPAFNTIQSDHGISARLANAIPAKHPDVTSTVLDTLSTAIKENGVQYGWKPACILWSDNVARVNALTFVADAVRERDQILNAT